MGGWGKPGVWGFWDESKVLSFLNGDYVYVLTLWQSIEWYTNDCVLVGMYVILQNL